MKASSRTTEHLDREHVLIVGVIDSGGFTPGWWVNPSRELLDAWPASIDRSGWFVSAIDDAGNAVARIPATVTETAVCGTEQSRSRLSALLQIPENASAVMVTEGDREVYRRRVLPRCRIAFAPLPERMERCRVRIDMHIDGFVPSDGAHVLLRWEAPAARAVPLAISPVTEAEPSLQVDLTDVPGGDGCRLIAVFHDGLRMETATSDPLDLPPRPARPVVVLPVRGMLIGAEGCLPLQGYVEGDGNLDALEWCVDGKPHGQGPSASVEGLSVGHHVVSLRYGDREECVEIEIVATQVPAAPPSGLVLPWRVRPVISIGEPVALAPSPRAARGTGEGASIDLALK